MGHRILVRGSLFGRHPSFVLGFECLPFGDGQWMLMLLLGLGSLYISRVRQ